MIPLFFENRHTVADYGYMSPPVLQALSELDEAGDLMTRLRKCYVSPYTQERVRNEALTQEELRSIMEWLEGRPDCTSSIKMGILLSECIRRWPHLIEDKIVGGYRHFTLLRNEAWLNPLTMNTSHCSIAQPDPILLEQAGLPHDFNPVPPRHEPEPQDELPLCA